MEPPTSTRLCWNSERGGWAGSARACEAVNNSRSKLSPSKTERGSAPDQQQLERRIEPQGGAHLHATARCVALDASTSALALLPEQYVHAQVWAGTHTYVVV